MRGETIPPDIRDRLDIAERNGNGHSSLSPSPSPYKGEGRGRKPKSVRFNEIPDPGPRRYHLEGLIPEGFPTLVYGDGGVAKSMLVLSFGLTLARGGEKWLGQDVGGGRPVLYLDFELDASEQRRRVNRLARGDGLDSIPDNLRYMSARTYARTI
jgi:hypothetical protein